MSKVPFSAGVGAGGVPLPPPYMVHIHWGPHQSLEVRFLLAQFESQILDFRAQAEISLSPETLF